MHVVDGDTIVVDVGGRAEKVRILGADTPETVDPRKPVQCYGPEASAHTKKRLPPGTRVTLETDAEVRDKYGRLLAYVYVGGARYDDELLRLGYARLLVIAPNGVHARVMLQEELSARRRRTRFVGRVPRLERRREDFLDDVGRGVRMQEREAADGLSVPARRHDERDLIVRQLLAPRCVPRPVPTRAPEQHDRELGLADQLQVGELADAVRRGLRSWRAPFRPRRGTRRRRAPRARTRRAGRGRRRVNWYA